MTVWKREFSLETLNRHLEGDSPRALSGHLGMRAESFGDDHLVFSMPVDRRTHQPMGLLHGGASVALAETVGSVAANLTLPLEEIALGQEINANHLRAVRSGRVYGTARALHLGGRSQVWSIEIRDEAGRLACISRLTMAVLPRPADTTPFHAEPGIPQD
ncbi:MAG: hotdog fold thioesterase [Gammaproteobacteria bacterium]